MDKKIISDTKQLKKGSHTIIKIGILLIVVLVAAAGVLYWRLREGRIYIEKAEISAPLISLSAKSSGKLEEMMVVEGEEVLEDQTVARVGNELVKAKNDGLVVRVNNDIGKNFNPGEQIVTMISPQKLRVIGHLEEDKGFTDVKVGQEAEFTIDALGSRKFIGIVDEVSETSRDSDIVFSISDKREKKLYDVKIRFNFAKYSEIKNGMSAQVWIYK